MRGLKAKNNSAIGTLIERHTEPCQLFDCPRCRSEDRGGNSLLAEAVASSERVRQMQ